MQYTVSCCKAKNRVNVFTVHIGEELHSQVSFLHSTWQLHSYQRECNVCLSRLLHSASNGHTACLRLLLDESDTADLIDAADSQGRWVLCSSQTNCFARRRLSVVPDGLTRSDWFSSRTPLLLAVAGGHVDCVLLLLERETDIHHADHQGLTALHLGVRLI